MADVTRTIPGEAARTTDVSEPRERVPTDDERSRRQMRRNAAAWEVKCGRADGALGVIEEQAERRKR